MCLTKYCKNKKIKGFCSTCRSRKSRENDPEKYAYNTTKANAKRRRKPFTITFEYFKQFCYEYNYIQGKGKTATSLSIDCKINDLGYVEGNIRGLPLGENSRKGTKVLDYDWNTKTARVIDCRQEQVADLPF